MKVISGSLKGRNIEGFDIIGTRPTMDRVKESVFGMIQNHLRNSVVLDLFSGSGNYGIEAISNGANKIFFNDYNKKCIKVIKNNLERFNVLKQAVITNLDYKKALDFYKEEGITFDLIFLDPPYKDKIIDEILDFINDNDLLNDKGLVICELTGNNLSDMYGNLVLFKERSYGEKQVFIYQKR